MNKYYRLLFGIVCSIALTSLLTILFHNENSGYPSGAFAQSSLPDLIVSDIRFSVPNPAVGQSTIPQAYISNIGTAVSDTLDNDVWFFEVDASGAVMRQLCDTRTVPSLVVGQTTNGLNPNPPTVDCTAQTFTQGTHLIQVVLNDVRTINELNYSNNSYTVSLSVGAGVNQPPSIFIEKPANGITYSSNIDISVTDVNGDAVSVKWCRQAGSIPCSTFTNTLTPPTAAIPEFTGMWNVANDANGPYQFCAQAVDTQGAVARSCVSTALSKPLPPGVPSIPIIEGPTTGAPNQTLSFGAYSTDPAGGEAEYQYDWGDGTKSNWTLPMEIGTQRDIETHAWTTTGVKCLKVTARNPSITTLSSTTPCYNVTISTSPPTTCSDGTANNQCSTNKPKFCSNGSLIDKASQCGCPTGQTAQGDSCTSSSSCTASVSTGATVTTKITSTDPDGDQLYYTINWGDSKTTRAPQSGTVASGFAATVTHKYCDPGTFTATGTASDTDGNTSVVSDPLKFCVSGASISNCDTPPAVLRGDLTCDGVVDARDLGILFFYWGKSSVDDPNSSIRSTCGTFLASIGKGLTPPLSATLDGDDLAILLGNWSQIHSGKPNSNINIPRNTNINTNTNVNVNNNTNQPPIQICTPGEHQPDKYTSQHCPAVCSADGFSWLDGDLLDNCPNYPPVTGLQPFPHIASFTWGGAVPWYDAKAGLMMTSSNSSGWADARKSLNPNMVLLTTRDINGGADIWKTPGAFPEAAWVHTSKGQTAAERCLLYSDDTFLANYTNYAQPLFNGKKYNQYVGDWFASLVPTPPFDGYGSDGLWPGEMVCTSDIDLNSNGVNDYTEGINVDAAFKQGAEVATQSLRDAVGNGYILLNSGGWDDTGWTNKNGMITEHASIGYPIDWWWWVKEKHDEFALNGRKPIILLLDANAGPSGYGGTPNPTMNDFQFMRYVLTLMSLNDGYVSITDYEAGEHYWTKWYDEFDVKLGLAISVAHEISPHVFVRFFQNGAVIHNSSATTVTVTDADIKDKAGYQGPYYRFLGGADPAVNNGQQLGSVTLSIRQLDPYLGDGIVLVNKPNTAVVSDIVVDNTLSGTSPGSSPAALSGFNQVQDCGDTVSNEYTVRCAIHYDSYPAAIALPNSSSNAIYTPNIGFAGQYEVFEWHGVIKNSPMASNVKHIITHAGGQETRMVDQSMNTGQWNSLGVYGFKKGGGNVIVSAEGADDPVIADAVMLRYKGP